jgi:hypothetical protein
MKVVELYGRVRYAVQIEGLSRLEAARQFGIDPRTVAKMLAFSLPPGYRRSRPPARPMLDPFTGIIDGLLAADEGRPRKAAAYLEADLRAASRRARLLWRWNSPRHKSKATTGIR